MANSLERHVDEAVAEDYSMGQLSARKVAEVETHLLTCEACRQAVSASDAYVAAMRDAASKVRKAEQRKPKRQVVGK